MLSWDRVLEDLLQVDRRRNNNSVGVQHIHIIVDCRATVSDEQLWHFIGMHNMEDQSMLRDGELQDGGALVTLARVGELTVQAHNLQTQKKFSLEFWMLYDISKF
jgi:hypothetical protein